MITNINYLSENIVLLDNKMYNDDILIKKHNWHKYLNELGWHKLHPKLIKILNKQVTYNYNNSQYGQLECGNDGNCLFDCISYSFNNHGIYNKNFVPITSYTLRQMISKSLSRERYLEIIELYKVLKDCGDLDEDWDPYNTTISEYKEMITNNKDIFWGDHILMDLLINILNINLVILDNNGVYNTMNIYKPHTITIVLLYENTNHFKLIGNFQENNMISLFNHRNLPLEIKNMINIK